MLRITPQYNAQAAVGYFRHHLRNGDYYTDESATPGIWGGRLAERLGLAGEVTDRAWSNLCHNRLPDGSDRLTLSTRERRRVSYDFTFNAPKSVSLAAALTQHTEVVNTAFREAVRETMRLIEKDAAARVRVGGAQDDRSTGNLLWAEFQHETARPVDGIPQPHLHTHCVVVNATHDPVEDRIKAAQFGPLKRDGPFYQAQFHHRLASNLQEVGFGIERTSGRFGWELQGYTPEMLSAFSERSEQIHRVAEARGATDPESRKRIAVATREAKANAKSPEEVRSAWEELATTVKLPRDRVTPEPRPIRSPDECVRLALEQHMEPHSIAPERFVQATAIMNAIGSASIDEVQQAWERRPSIVRVHDGDRILVTTKGVIAQELEVMEYARSGKGHCRPWTELGASVTNPSTDIHKDGRTQPRSEHDPSEARKPTHAERVLASRDRVTMIRGVAGSGKTTLMHEVIGGINASGQNVVVLAPTVDASRRVLRDGGFPEANTVAAFLRPGPLQAQAKRGVIWVDEAGQLTLKDAVGLVRAARDMQARIVLSGDPKQHRSVLKGQVMSLLEHEAGCKPVVLRTIRRQHDPRWRDVVQDLAEHRTDSAWARLQKLDAIREIKRDDHLLLAVAKEYANTRAAGQSVLVVVPTHGYGDRVTSVLREQLRSESRITGNDRAVERLSTLDWTEPERRQAHRYEPGMVVQFLRPGGGIAAGTRGDVVAVDPTSASVTIRTSVGDRLLPLDHAEKFQVYRKDELPIAVGETMRITQSTRLGSEQNREHRRTPQPREQSSARRELSTGQMVTVVGFTEAGSINLSTGDTVPKSFGHWTHGYVKTSPASQGWTVDVAIGVQPTPTFGAASAEQFYVTVSRARHQSIIFTDNAKGLQQAVQRSNRDLSALTLLRESQNLALARHRGDEHEHAKRLVQLPPVQRKITDRRQIQITRERGRGR